MTAWRLAAAGLALPALAAAALLPRYGGEVRLLVPAPPPNLDPARIRGPVDLAWARAVHATLVELDAAGAPRPGLLAALPEPEPGGRSFRLRLQPGLRFHDGAPLAAAAVAESLARLLRPETRSPNAWLALAVEGAEAVRLGRLAAPSGVEVLSDLELRLRLEAPLDLARALAALPAAPVSPGGAGAGPFRPVSRDGSALRLVAFEAHRAGRPYGDALVLEGADARQAARALERGEADLVLRPEAVAGGESRDLPALTATYALVNPRRLGPFAGPLRAILAGLDRAELARRFVRGPAAPLAAALPPPLAPPAAPPPAAPQEAPPPGPPRLVLLVAAGAAEQRGLAERLQVKLFDRGFSAAIAALAPDELEARVAAGEHDLALVSVTFVSPLPSLAAVQLAWALGGAPAARRALERLASAEPAAAASEALEAAHAVPLVATGLRATAGPRLAGLSPLADGTFDPGDLWLLPPAAAGVRR